jgi:hypothetical protein
MTPAQRQDLAIHALAGIQTITALAEEHEVSRRFVYAQAEKATEAIQDAFAPATPEDPLFTVPVTKAWLEQLVLALTLVGHSSMRGVVEILRDLFDYPISLGKVHAIVQKAVPTAQTHNARQDLANVRIGAHDEIFQARRPVLVGADVDSTFCYLLSQEDHRDAETWALRLLELQDRGFAPQATIADFGTGLRAGQKLALKDIPCHGDLFHLLQELTELLQFAENRAYEAIENRTRLEHQQANRQRRTGRLDPSLGQRLRHARPAEELALTLAEDLALLVHWLRDDVLALAGPDAECRGELYDFIVAELRARAPQYRHRLDPIVRLLANRRAEVLAFAVQLDQDLAALAAAFAIPVTLVRQLFNVQALDPRRSQRWADDAQLRQQLGARYHALSQATAALARDTVRASSVIENLNSRLRPYFFLRRQLGSGYLSLLQFFLNHRQFLRSEHAERVGKSPCELLTSQPHAHWLELLGYQRFRRN